MATTKSETKAVSKKTRPEASASLNAVATAAATTGHSAGARPTSMQWPAERHVTPAAHNARRRYAIFALRFVVDILMYFAATWTAYSIRYGDYMLRHFSPDRVLPYKEVLTGMLMGLPLLLLFMKISGLYETQSRVKTLDSFPRIVSAANAYVLALMIALFLLDTSDGYRGYVLVLWLCNIFFLFIGRVFLQAGYKVAGKTDVLERNTLLVGAGQVGKSLACKLARHPEFGLRPIGFIDDTPLQERFVEPEISELRILGGVSDITEILDTYNVENVIVGFTRNSHESLLDLISQCNNAGVECSVLPRLFEIITDEVPVREIGGISMVAVNKKGLSGPNLVLKALEDYILTTIGLLVAWPLLLAIAIAIKLDSRGPVFYKQTRIGRYGRPFSFYKFRSMVVNADEMQADLVCQTQGEGDWRCWKMQDDPRVTRVGKFIRKFSLDELPQVFNVLLGDMSLVGPRPHIVQEVDQYEEWHRLRLNVKPGITGLWQVNGRSDVPFDEMVKYDLYYIESWSLWLDIKTILRTISAVLAGKGAY